MPRPPRKRASYEPDRLPPRPVRLNICGRRYVVRAKVMPEFFGLCEPDKLRITVDARAPRQHVQDTLLHETMHAIEAHFGLQVPERTIEKLATGVLTVLQENPALVRYLTKPPAD